MFGAYFSEYILCMFCYLGIPFSAKLAYPATIQEFEKRFINFISLPDHGVAVACAQEKIVGLVALLIVSDATRIHYDY